MKNIKTNKKNLLIVGIVTLTLIFSFTSIQSSFQQEKIIIIGTWIPDGSPESEWVFTSDGILKDYENNQLDDTYNWSISTTTPQCGKGVPVGNNFSYLSITNVNDANDKYCYEILSLNDKYLQIRWIERGGFLLYEKK